MKPLEIKGARARLGFTQKYMAEKLGLTEVSYGRKERGEVEFTLDEVPEVASLLTLNNAQVNDFFLRWQVANWLIEAIIGVGVYFFAR